MADDSMFREVARLVAAARPDVEVWDVQVVPDEDLVRVLIDHVDGVDVDLCAAVTRALDPLRGEHALEVSSPGVERPLVRPAHFERAVGEMIEVRLTAAAGATSARGLLAACDATSLRLVVDDSDVVVDRATIATSNIVWNPVRS